MLNWNVPVNIDGVLRMGWHPIRWEYREGFHLEYSVRDWPNTLIRAVEIGLQVVKD